MASAAGRAIEPRVRLAAALVGGFGLLLVRPWLAGSGPSAVAALGAVYVALAAVSITPLVVGRDTAQLSSWVVLAAGMGALLLARMAAGPSVPPRAAGLMAIGLNSAAAVSEELFFRRFLYGWLSRLGVPVAVGGSALAFALIHVPSYGLAAFWVDLGAGLLLGWQRWASGTWLAPAGTHLTANLLTVLR